MYLQNLFLSLQNKNGKDYYGTVNELTERVLSRRARLGREDQEGGRESRTAVQIGGEIISADRGGVPAAVSIRAEYNEDAPVRKQIDGIYLISFTNSFKYDTRNCKTDSRGKETSIGKS